MWSGLRLSRSVLMTSLSTFLIYRLMRGSLVKYWSKRVSKIIVEWVYGNQKMRWLRQGQRWLFRLIRYATCWMGFHRRWGLRMQYLAPLWLSVSGFNPGFCRHQGGRWVPRQDHGPEPTLANRLHLPQGHRLGLVLSVDRSMTIPDRSSPGSCVPSWKRMMWPRR